MMDKITNLLKRVHPEWMSSVLLLILIFSFLYRNLDFSKMWAFGDLMAFPTDLNLMSEVIFYSWKEEGIGLPNSSQFNYFVVMLLSSAIFGNFVAQKLLFLAILPISFFIFYYFLRNFNFKFEVSFLGALLYSINPVTISSFEAGGIRELMTFAIFPLFILYLWKLVVEEKFTLKYLAILAVLALFLFNIYVTFWYGLIILPGLLLIGLRKNAKRFSRLLPIFVIVALILFPTILVLSGPYRGISMEEISFKSHVEYCYSDTSFQNLIRLAGNTGSAQREEALNYNTLNYYTTLGYILSFVALSSLFFIRKGGNKKEDVNKTLLIFVASICLVILIGILLTIRGNPGLIDFNPVISSLRNPVKLMYPLVFCFSLLFSYGTEEIFHKFSKKKFPKKIIILFLIFIILFYNYPALDGTLGLEKTRGNQYVVGDKYSKLPKILEKLDTNYKEYRFLFLPWEYCSNLRIRSELPNYFGTPLGAQIEGINILKVKEILDSICYNSSNKRDGLSLFNVRYIIVDKTFKGYYKVEKWYKNIREDYKSSVYYSHNSYWLTGDTAYFYAIFIDDSNFELVYEDDDFAIFRNNNAIPKVYSYAEDTNLATSLDTPVANFSFEQVSIIEKGIIKKFPQGIASFHNDSYSGNSSLKVSSNVTEGRLWSRTTEVNVTPKEKYLAITHMKYKNVVASDISIEGYNETSGEWRELGQIPSGQTGTSDWKEYKQILTIPENITKIGFVLNAGWIKDQEVGNATTWFDDISVYPVKDYLDVIWLYSTKNNETVNELFKTNETPAVVINYTKINPTKYEVKVTASKPFMLSFAVAYDPLWEAMVYKDGEKVEVVKSVPLYSVINGFWIDETGDLEIEIRYKPQEWFVLGLWISGMTFIFCIGFLFYDWRRGKGGKWTLRIGARRHNAGNVVNKGFREGVQRLKKKK
jgi:hypothetical protein